MFHGAPFLNGRESISFEPGSPKTRKSQIYAGVDTLFPSTKSPAPIGLFQMALPISIQEVLIAIQEHFGTQLLEYHILIRGVQH